MGQQEIQCAASVLPNFNLKTLEGGSQKKKEKEPFQHEILRTTSVLPNFNLETLRRESQKKKEKEPFQQEILNAASVLPNFNLKTLETGSQKKRKSTIPTRNSMCCFCSPEFQSKNTGKRGPKKKRRRNHSNKKF